MGLTLDEIVNKEFQVVANGYDSNEVDDFLDAILEEMQSREKTSKSLRKQVSVLTDQVASLQSALDQAKQQIIERREKDNADAKGNQEPCGDTPEIMHEAGINGYSDTSYTDEIQNNYPESAGQTEETKRKIEDYIKENKLSLRYRLLDSLGLFEYQKEYAPENLSYTDALYQGYGLSETVNGIVRHYKKGNQKIYPQITDEEYEVLLQIAKEKESLEEKKELVNKDTPTKKEPQEYIVRAERATGECYAGNLLEGLAWFLWIGGIIASLLLSVKRSYYETTIDWMSFFTMAIIYILSGCLCRGMSGIASDIHVISSAITSLHIKEDNK